MELQNDNPLTTFEVEDVPLSSPFPIVHSPSHHFSSSSSSTTTCDGDEKKRKDGHGRKKNKFQETRHPTYKELRRRDNKRVCELRRPLHKGSCICLGTFPTPEMAAPARAHDTAAVELGARLNFSEEQPEFLPRANSCSMSSVRHAAANHNQAANNNNNNNNNKYSSATAHHYSSSSSRCEEMKLLEHCRSVEEQVFMDEEALFNFPGLLDSMAEGLMVSPPAMQRGFYRDSVDDFVELCLWTHD